MTDAAQAKRTLLRHSDRVSEIVETFVEYGYSSWVVGVPDQYRSLLSELSKPELLELSDGQAVNRIKERAERPVGDVMQPIKVTLQHDDHLMKIIYEMVENNLSMIPVLEDGSVVGVVRSVDVLDEVSKLVL